MKPPLSLLLLLLLVVTTTLAQARTAPSLKLVEGKTSYLSGGKTIRVDTYLPADNDRHPAVLVLYGSGGALFGKGEMVDLAKQLAGQGNAVFLVHYFNRTGTHFVTNDGPIHENQAVWTDTVEDGVDFAVSHPRVRSGPVGLCGYSLGAYLAVSEGARDRRIGAVVELAGGIFAEVRPHLKRYPPLLILHGRLDQRVSVNRAFELEKTWKRAGAKPQIHIYENEGHRLSDPALADATQRSLQFINQHLHRGKDPK